MLVEIFLIVALSRSIQCSIVIEAENQKGIYISDYCPKMKYCPEGAHTMCMFYNPNRVMGPRCRNFQNVSMTPEIANKLLDVSNAVRSKIARGMEKGKNGDHLPRGYGIFRLKWDSELATFAQVLANQCVLRHDLCRASKKFPEPGQTAGLVRFSVPEWIPVSKSGNFTSRGLNDEKLMYATTQTLKSWYGQKSFISPQMVTSYPDWSKDPNNQSGRLYMEMIYGSATHMGCGISAYTEYGYYDNDAPLNYNSVQMICNFSARPRAGTAVFNTVPPSDTESPFNPCGCPAGSVEDDDCLCLEIPRETESPPVIHQKTSCPGGIDCAPTVVLLPIFTIEDAPPDKLVTAKRFSNTSMDRLQHQMEAVDSFEELFNNHLSGNEGVMHQSRKKFQLPPHGGPRGQKQRPFINHGVTVRNRHFDPPGERKNNHNLITHFNPNDAKDHNRIKYLDPNEIKDKVIIRKRHFEPSNGEDHVVRSHDIGLPNEKSRIEIDHNNQKQTHKQMQRSIFTKTPIFELPGSHYLLSTRKSDVVARKDFSVGKQLVKKYLYNKNNIIPAKGMPKFQHSHENIVIEVKSLENLRLNDDQPLHAYIQTKEHTNNSEHNEQVHFHDILTTETNLNTAEQNVINHNKEIVVLNKTTKTTNAADDNDKKIMALLDTLEQQVKHIELRDKEKQIFNAKIKKIYGKVVGKSSTALSITENPHTVHIQKIKDPDILSKIDDEVHKLPPPFDAQDDESNYIDEPNYRKNDIDADIDGIPKRDTIDVEPIDVERPVITKPKTYIPYERRVKHTRRNKNNVKNRNRIDSFEFERHRYDNGYKRKKTYKDIFGNDLDKLKHRSNNLDYKKNKNYYSDAYEDPLSIERRKYYQNKLDSMERKLQDVRRYNNRRKDAGRTPHMRAMKPSIRSDNQINPLYAGRARILHGY